MGSPLLAETHDILFMPDLFNFLLTGEKATEFTFATTSQLYNPVKADWEEELLRLIGLPNDFAATHYFSWDHGRSNKAGDQAGNRIK